MTLGLAQRARAGAGEREVSALARLLSRRDSREAWVRLQVLAAELYQLTPAEFAHVLGTFPLVASVDRQAAKQAYESARRG